MVFLEISYRKQPLYSVKIWFLRDFQRFSSFYFATLCISNFNKTIWFTIQNQFGCTAWPVWTYKTIDNYVLKRITFFILGKKHFFCFILKSAKIESHFWKQIFGDGFKGLHFLFQVREKGKWFFLKDAT